MFYGAEFQYAKALKVTYWSCAIEGAFTVNSRLYHLSVAPVANTERRCHHFSCPAAPELHHDCVCEYPPVCVSMRVSPVMPQFLSNSNFSHTPLPAVSHRASYDGSLQT